MRDNPIPEVQPVIRAVGLVDEMSFRMSSPASVRRSRYRNGDVGLRWVCRIEASTRRRGGATAQ